MEGESKATKLIINLRDGIVQVEGDEAFVRDVYNDFKEQVSKPVLLSSIPPAQLEQHNGGSEGEAVVASPAPRIRAKVRRPATAAATGKGDIGNYKPVFNSALDLSALGDFYGRYQPANHPEKILIFASFLKDVLKVNPVTANDVFTCYQTLKDRTKTPEAFVQAFRDAQNKTHYIDFISPQDIQVTIAGANHFNLKMKKAV